MERLQINFRLDKETADRLDKQRVALMEEMGRIPSRSEVFRIALERYLNDEESGRAATRENV